MKPAKEARGVLEEGACPTVHPAVRAGRLTEACRCHLRWVAEKVMDNCLEGLLCHLIIQSYESGLKACWPDRLPSLPHPDIGSARE